MKYTIQHIARIISATATVRQDTIIEQLLTDSRRLYAPATSLFFALKGPRQDGHQFIRELYAKGVINFVVSQPVNMDEYPEANFLQVTNTLDALQQLAAAHRQHFHIPVIGITGSNGKTIVKEWLYQLLHEDFNIVRSPKSYNSQIGVPLSVWGMQEKNTLAIFEAGISRPGEMNKLERIIRPTIGVLTNIGEAHSEGFDSNEQKAAEKKILFRNAQMPSPLHIVRIEKRLYETVITAGSVDDTSVHSVTIPFTDDASVENAITCWQVLLALGISREKIGERMQQLQPVSMRLELKKGINHCAIINDSYSADLSSLQIALNFLDQQSAGTQKTVILSDFLQSAVPDAQLYSQVIASLEKHGVQRVIGIGDRISAHLKQHLQATTSVLRIEYYPGTQAFIQQFRSSAFRDETILIKGARLFGFEQIVQLLEQKAHQTILEINLNAVAHNLKQYQQQLNPYTKVMAMVKAFAYGSGGAEVAGILQFHKVDYLGVAYADEGVELRKAGITTPIMVMNPEVSAFEAITENNLEPEIYSFGLLHAFDQYLKKEGLQYYPVHVEMETGMNRLGFTAGEIPSLANELASGSSFKVQSFFSHLAASEEVAQDEFTQQQFAQFERAAGILEERLGYPVLKHIANSAAVTRHPHLQLDMVRLGIGLYGVDSSGGNTLHLQTVATLRSTVAQLKKLHPGDSVSYNRKGMVQQESVIATIRMGYADGYPRRLGNGAGKVWIGGKLAPVIGTVCMDMFMVDVTAIPGVKEGDEVIIFGRELPVQQVAAWAGTIPYEIMTGISQRVKRVYYEE
ncbi:MAG: alanine racemase [Bacteroidetes bacterium]|nr:alanine racemase [Bacteroidota bacterium]